MAPGLRRWHLPLLAAGSVLFWGASFPLTKVALQWMGPTALAFLRWAISSAVLGAYLAARGRGRLRSAATGGSRGNPGGGREPNALGVLLRREGATVLWVALTGITVFYFLENTALLYTTVVNAGVLANLITVFMVLLGTVWLGEQLGRGEWAATAIAFVGAVLVSQGSGHLSLTASGLRGDLMMVLAALLAALYSIGGKRLVATYPADAVMTAVSVVGTVFLLPLAAWEGLSVALPAGAWLALLALGVGSGALANLWWMEILARADASRAALLLFLVPVVSTAVAVLFLGEPLPLTVLIGAFLVLAGVAIVQRKHPEGPAASKAAGADLPPLGSGEEGL